MQNGKIVLAVGESTLGSRVDWAPTAAQNKP